jgi:hypothetical protein
VGRRNASARPLEHVFGNPFLDRRLKPIVYCDVKYSGRVREFGNHKGTKGLDKEELARTYDDVEFTDADGDSDNLDKKEEELQGPEQKTQDNGIIPKGVEPADVDVGTGFDLARRIYAVEAAKVHTTVNGLGQLNCVTHHSIVFPEFRK